MHNRVAIKNATKALLLGATNAGANVHKNRWPPLDDEDLPALLVYTLEERVEEFDIEKDRRVLELIVEVVDNGANADDTIETLTDQVEDILLGAETLSETVDSVRLTRTSIANDQENPGSHVAARMIFEAVYFTKTVPDKTLDDFNRADITYIDATNKDTVDLTEE